MCTMIMRVVERESERTFPHVKQRTGMSMIGWFFARWNKNAWPNNWKIERKGYYAIVDMSYCRQGLDFGRAENVTDHIV